MPRWTAGAVVDNSHWTDTPYAVPKNSFSSNKSTHCCGRHQGTQAQLRDHGFIPATLKMRDHIVTGRYG